MVYELLSVVCRAVWVCSCAHVVYPGTGGQIGFMSSCYSLLNYASYNWVGGHGQHAEGGIGPLVRWCIVLYSAAAEQDYVSS
ncbi:hypothetical protein EDB84DRAFT_1528926 [Lactarius hengduanensis]|nr:hypothetical protein EDB84DRAFT_1528926 [Lactarius hengduanensis]